VTVAILREISILLYDLVEIKMCRRFLKTSNLLFVVGIAYNIQKEDNAEGLKDLL